jgi:hypothetical protein
MRREGPTGITAPGGTTGTRAAGGTTAAVAEDGVFRIHWVPGTDRLLAVCFCAEERVFEDPVELWDWLLAHPDHPHGVGK